MRLRIVTTVPRSGELSSATVSTHARMMARPRPDSGRWATEVPGSGDAAAAGPTPTPSSATSTWQPTAPRLVTTAYPPMRPPPCNSTLVHASVAASRMSSVDSSSTPSLRSVSPSTCRITGTLSLSHRNIRQNRTSGTRLPPIASAVLTVAVIPRSRGRNQAAGPGRPERAGPGGPGSAGTQRELLDDRVAQQLARQLCDDGHSGLVRGALDLHLEPLSLPDRQHLPEPEAPAGAGDGISLRVTDPGLGHDFHDHPCHVSSRAIRAYIVWTGACPGRHPDRDGPPGHAAYATAPRRMRKGTETPVWPRW